MWYDLVTYVFLRIRCVKNPRSRLFLTCPLRSTFYAQVSRGSSKTAIDLEAVVSCRRLLIEKYLEIVNHPFAGREKNPNRVPSGAAAARGIEMKGVACGGSRDGGAEAHLSGKTTASDLTTPFLE